MFYSFPFFLTVFPFSSLWVILCLHSSCVLKNLQNSKTHFPKGSARPSQGCSPLVLSCPSSSVCFLETWLPLFCMDCAAEKRPSELQSPRQLSWRCHTHTNSQAKPEQPTVALLLCSDAFYIMCASGPFDYNHHMAKEGVC